MAVILNASTSSGFIQTADTSGELNLQSNGSTKLSVLSTGVSGTIVQGTAVASTSGTSIDFTGIPSWAKRITVMVNGVSINGTSNFLVQLGDSGGIENTGYVSGCSDGASPTFSTVGLILSISGTAAETVTGQMIISNLNGNSWVSSSVINNSSYGTIMGAGSKTLSATLDRVRITTTSGTATFDAGTINIQYEG